MTSQAAAILDFLNFQILFKFSLLYLNLTGKQHLAVKMHEIATEYIEKLKVFNKFPAIIETSQSTHRLRNFLR